MHFMYPVPLMPLVEIIRGITTSDAVSSYPTLSGNMPKQGHHLSFLHSSGGFGTWAVLVITVSLPAFGLVCS